MVYENIDGMKIVELPVQNFEIVMVDAKKKSAATNNYANAGFFGTYHEGGEAFTLPAGHLICDYAATSSWTKKYCTERGIFYGDKFMFDSGSWDYQNSLYGHSVSTLVIKNGIANVIDLDHMTYDYDYAISGIPIMRGGEDVTFATYVKGQGWDASPLYGTYHVFIGLKDDNKKVYVIGMKTKTGNMITSAEAYNKFKPLGFKEVIKLDGGGSYIFNVDGDVEATSENRRINTIIIFNDEVEKQPEEGDKNKMFKIALDAGHYLGTPGKRCLKSIDPNETREWVLNDKVADKVEELLKDYDGYDLIRVDDTTGEKEIDLDERTDAANDFDADFYLSVHHNAGINGGSGGGIVAYCYPDSADGAAWRDSLYNALIKHTGLKGNRSSPLQTSSGLYVLKHTAMPAVLLELGFMDSTTDTPIILTDEHAVQCAEAIVEVLAEKGSLTKKENADTQPENPSDTDTPDEPENEATGENKGPYNTVEEVPDWGKETVQKLIDKGVFLGTEEGLDISYDMLRILVINDRAGLYD